MWSNRENCKDLTTLQAIQQHLPKALDVIVVYEVTLLPDPSEYTSGCMEYPCLSGGSFPTSALLAQVSPIRSSPASGNAPLGNQGTREPTGSILSKVGQ